MWTVSRAVSHSVRRGMSAQARTMTGNETCWLIQQFIYPPCLPPSLVSPSTSTPSTDRTLHILPLGRAPIVGFASPVELRATRRVLTQSKKRLSHSCQAKVSSPERCPHLGIVHRACSHQSKLRLGEIGRATAQGTRCTWSYPLSAESRARLDLSVW